MCVPFRSMKKGGTPVTSPIPGSKCRLRSAVMCAPDKEGWHARDVRQPPERAHQRVAEPRAQRHAGQQLGRGLPDQRAVAGLRLARLLVCIVLVVCLTGA